MAACISTAVMAQKEFTQIYEVKFPVDADSRGINADRTLTWATDWTELAMMDAVTGKVLWTCNFKEKFGIKKAKSYNYIEEKQVLELKLKMDKDNDKIVYLDPKSGNTLDEGTVAKLGKPAKSGLFSYMKPRQVFKSWIETEGSVITLDYESKFTTGPSKPKKTTATVTCTGANKWTTQINIQVVRSLLSNSAEVYGGPDVGNGDFLTLYARGNKIFVLYEGLSVLDMKTGKLLWETTFDNSIFDFGLMKLSQELGRAAWPIPVNDAVYIADLSEKSRCIKKLNIETGAELWKGEELPKDAIIPGLYICGNTLVAQSGGKIEKQVYIPGTSGRPDVYKREYRFDGDFGIKAYDAASGKMLWQTSDKKKELNDKFSSLITNTLTDEKNIYVGSSKFIYCFEAATGKVIYALPAEDLKIGKPDNIWFYNENIILEGEEGVASINKGTGKVNYSTNTKKCLATFNIGNAFFVWNGKNPEDWSAFVRVDIDNGAILGKIAGTSYPKFSEDGEEFVKFDGNKIMRYKTKS